jgi:predicted 2-oxoglutarate/Fe(II)-dependent dioxygenase YbiX
MDFRGQLNARLVFMAFFWGPNFSKTRKHRQTPYKNTHLSEVQPLLSEELRNKPLYLAISLSLSLTIRIKFNFTVASPEQEPGAEVSRRQG